MSSSDPAGPTIGQELPELHESLLTTDDLASLVRDIATLTRVTEIIPKTTGPRQHIPEQSPAITLDEAHTALVDGQLRALQLRYIHDNAHWWDTLMPTPTGNFKIVRIRHDF